MFNKAQNEMLRVRGFSEATFQSAPPEIRLLACELADVPDPVTVSPFTEAQIHFLRGRDPATLDEDGLKHLAFWGDPVFSGKILTTPVVEIEAEPLARAAQPVIDRAKLDAAHPDRRLSFGYAQETLARAAAEAKSPVKTVRMADIEAAKQEVDFFTKQSD